MMNAVEECKHNNITNHVEESKKELISEGSHRKSYSSYHTSKFNIKESIIYNPRSELFPNSRITGIRGWISKDGRGILGLSIFYNGSKFDPDMERGIEINYDLESGENIISIRGAEWEGEIRGLSVETDLGRWLCIGDMGSNIDRDRDMESRLFRIGEGVRERAYCVEVGISTYTGRLNMLGVYFLHSPTPQLSSHLHQLGTPGDNIHIYIQISPGVHLVEKRGGSRVSNSLVVDHALHVLTRDNVGRGGNVTMHRRITGIRGWSSIKKNTGDICIPHGIEIFYDGQSGGAYFTHSPPLHLHIQELSLTGGDYITSIHGYSHYAQITYLRFSSSNGVVFELGGDGDNGGDGDTETFKLEYTDMGVPLEISDIAFAYSLHFVYISAQYIFPGNREGKEIKEWINGIDTCKIEDIPLRKCVEDFYESGELKVSRGLYPRLVNLAYKHSLYPLLYAAFQTETQSPNETQKTQHPILEDIDKKGIVGDSTSPLESLRLSSSKAEIYSKLEGIGNYSPNYSHDIMYSRAPKPLLNCPLRECILEHGERYPFVLCRKCGGEVCLDCDLYLHKEHSQYMDLEEYTYGYNAPEAHTGPGPYFSRRHSIYTDILRNMGASCIIYPIPLLLLNQHSYLLKVLKVGIGSDIENMRYIQLRIIIPVRGYSNNNNNNNKVREHIGDVWNITENIERHTVQHFPRMRTCPLPNNKYIYEYCTEHRGPPLSKQSNNYSSRDLVSIFRGMGYILREAHSRGIYLGSINMESIGYNRESLDVHFLNLHNSVKLSTPQAVIEGEMNVFNLFQVYYNIQPNNLPPEVLLPFMGGKELHIYPPFIPGMADVYAFGQIMYMICMGMGIDTDTYTTDMYIDLDLDSPVSEEEYNSKVLRVMENKLVERGKECGWGENMQTLIALVLNTLSYQPHDRLTAHQLYIFSTLLKLSHSHHHPSISQYTPRISQYTPLPPQLPQVLRYIKENGEETGREKDLIANTTRDTIEILENFIQANRIYTLIHRKAKNYIFTSPKRAIAIYDSVIQNNNQLLMNYPGMGMEAYLNKGKVLARSNKLEKIEEAGRCFENALHLCNEVYGEAYAVQCKIYLLADIANCFLQIGHSSRAKDFYKCELRLRLKVNIYIYIYIK